MEKSKILLVEDDFNLGIVIQDFYHLKGILFIYVGTEKKDYKNLIKTNMTYVY